jgi:hypothetical protein
MEMGKRKSVGLDNMAFVKVIQLKDETGKIKKKRGNRIAAGYGL